MALPCRWTGTEPYWAGFAVAFVSLATIGQSLNKAAMRMLGTLVAVVVALTIIALFSQSRWLFMLLLSLWVGFCTYMMGGTSTSISGTSAASWRDHRMDAGPDSVNAFDIAILRAQETGLGILVYSLVAVLLWPSNSGKTSSLPRQSGLDPAPALQAYSGTDAGQGAAEKAQALRGQEVQDQTRFEPAPGCGGDR